MAICPKCSRVMLRCEEDVFVNIDIDMHWVSHIIGHAVEDSYREHVCRPKVNMETLWN